MKNKGFTLIEMLAVVVLLALLVMVSYPKVTEQIRLEKQKLKDNESQILYKSAYSYIEDNKNDYPVRSGNVFCISISDLNNKGRIPVTLKQLSYESKIKVTVAANLELNYSVIEKSEPCSDIKNK